MAILTKIWLKTEQLEKLVNGLKSKNLKGIECLVRVSDEVNEYGQNASIHIPGNEEKSNFYFGNGNLVWNDGKLTQVKGKEKEIKVYELVEVINQSQYDNEANEIDDSDDLPF
jgi:hypothetical protein